MTVIEDQSPVAGAPPPPETDAATPVLSFGERPAYAGPVVALAAYGPAANTAAVRIEAGEDARALLPHLARLRLVEIAFPRYRDGRGYSSARILREAGFAGELRAVGDVLVDQLPLMRRVGFDSFACRQPLDPAAVERALGRYPFDYQKAADGRPPVWELRHG